MDEFLLVLHSLTTHVGKVMLIDYTFLVILKKDSTKYTCAGFVCMCIYIYICVCINVCVHIYICVHIYVCVCTHVYVCSSFSSILQITIKDHKGRLLVSAVDGSLPKWC